MSGRGLDRRHIPWLVAGGLGLVAIAVAGSLWLTGGENDAVSGSSEHYLHEVLLGDQHAVDAAHAVAVNADGLVAAVVDPPGDDRPRVVYTEGIHAPQDVSRTDLLRRSAVGGLDVDRRGNIIGVIEHTRAGVTRRRAIQWGVFAGGRVRTIADGVWGEDGMPVGDTIAITGLHPTIGDVGPALAIAEVTDGVDDATFRLLDPRGDFTDLETDARLDEDPLRPSIADDGRIVASVGDRLVTVETGIGRVETLAEAPAGARIGLSPAVSADGRVIAYLVEADGGPVLHALRRDGEGWAGPVELDAQVTVDDVDEPLAVGSQRHPPEIGDVGLVLLRGRASDGDQHGLWTVVLHDAEDGTLDVTEVRPAVLVGDTIAGRSITEVHAGGDLAVPRTPLVGQPAAHWIVFAAETDDLPIVVRAVPAGSGLEREARLPDHHDP